MESFKFASVTYCTNVLRGAAPSHEEGAFVAKQVFEIFETKLKSTPYSKEISVGRIEYGVGCILTTITLTATVGALYKFVKDYPKFRPGLVLLLKDLNGIYLKHKGTEAKGSTYLMRDYIPELEELEKIAADSASGKKKPTKKTTGVKRRLGKLGE